MFEKLHKLRNGQRIQLRIFLLIFALVFAGAFTGCQSGTSGTAQEELSEEDRQALAEMEEEVLDEEEIQEAFEDDLFPLDEEELALMENATGDAAAEDDEMTPLDEAELEQLDAFEEEEGDWSSDTEDDSSGGIQVEEDGTYTSKEEVAVYLHTFGHLPSNYITKSEAQKLGWDSSKGNLGEVAPGMSIGGDKFGNYEGMLPEEEGRTYRECDIDFDGGYRNEKRIIYSNDGLIFYTGDHYNTFEQIY